MILKCIGCSDSNEQPIPIRTLPVPKNLLDTRCNLPEIHIRSFNKAPNKVQKVNETSGTRITKATIDCKNFQINIMAQFNSSGTEDQFLTIHYGKKPIELVRNQGDSVGGGYLNFLGVDDQFVYYSITGVSLSGGVIRTYYCFNWRNGKEYFFDSDTYNSSP
ncbi:hypothetical protein [Leptospira interrogans]|uniref:Uncharacterized protein n=1 Tax=Leptospira interrogans serovar Lora str. TE 1992 TaxID=1193028 RepID=M3F028_LEPIR|nr:hypothetical protein [Leptospira interrogans]EMF43997.1 hypothetical protein LEP1GSC067_1714 [Leptospira interrogans serovar Lora str. TE 1992]AKH78709.1 hypothetical protein BRAT_17730 [Leptospira interrogans serovar Bratislava]EKR15956.1 hypothetical protein LEP1GSC019_1247 [Leptospira interrogans serovar Pyrogenes str. 2006006960]KLO75578.1 Uncharacterized protein AAY48_3329 [Leptospira interrogans serovar Muenchen]KWV25020.1 hypothetical protein LA733_1593 [Leptospira interrogans]